LVTDVEEEEGEAEKEEDDGGGVIRKSRLAVSSGGRCSRSWLDVFAAVLAAVEQTTAAVVVASVWRR
jgi:hypothetical protein